MGAGTGTGRRAQGAEQPATGLGQRPRQQILAAGGVRTEHDRRSQQIQRGEVAILRLAPQRRLELGLLTRVEQAVCRPHGPVLAHADRVVGVKAVGRHRGRVDEPLGAYVAGRPKGVERAIDVDFPDPLRRRIADEHEREVDDDVGPGERLAQHVGVAHVAAAVLELGPSVRFGVEGAARDADDSAHARLFLQQGDEAEAKGSGGTRDGDVEWRLGGGHESENIPSVASDVIRCVVETPKGSRNKYEYDPRSGDIVLDRFLSSSVVYPTDYGFVPETLAPDGDELDVLICVSEPTFPGCVIVCRAIGLFDMKDEEGLDSKVLCVPCGDPVWNRLERLDDLPEQLRAEITHFFTIYKELEPGKKTEIGGWRDRDAALEEVEQARRRYASDGREAAG